MLTFVRHYLPGYKSGGPVRTIANMVAALGDELDFRIVTSDRDATDTGPYPHLDAEGRWLEVGKAKVLYFSPSQMKLRNIARIVSEIPHDTLYLNSFFDPFFTLKPLLARWLCLAPEKRCVIAPRGEFSQGALELKSAKKKAFLAVSRASGFHRNLVWQASSEYEAEDVTKAMGGIAANICVSADLPAQVDGKSVLSRRPRKEGEPLRICFLSRISPKKNLDFALEVLQRVKSPIRFDIYGPIRDENYWSRCEALMGQLPTHVKAAYRGSVEHNRVSSILAGYDLFFLPTLGENYGHVIIEALASGTPVLIADTTPWRNLANIGVGWDLPLQDPEAFVRTVDQATELSSAERMQMREQALAFAENRRTDFETVNANRNLFAHAAPA